MSIEELSPYSPDTVYGQLTSPFTPKKVTINAHTPYDKASESNDSTGVYSRASFERNNQTRSLYGSISADSAYDSDMAKLGEELAAETVSANVSNFSSSELSSSDIVRNSLKNGYDTDEAIVIQYANSAYQKSAFLTSNPVGVLSSCSYRVF